MKKAFLSFVFLLSALFTQAQDCQYTTITGADGAEIKSTKESLMFEKVFGGTSTFIFFSLTNSDGIPVLSFQLLSKSTDFSKAYCFDKNSKIYVQLLNGKIITLMSINESNCSNMVYDGNEKKNIGVLTGNFLFTKGSMEELEKSPIAFIRIKYSGETADYPISREIKSETMGTTYNPENYFINNLKCIE